MRFIETTKAEIERLRSTPPVPYHDMVSELEKFLSMNVEAAKVVLDDNEYKTVRTAYQSIFKQVRYHNLPISVYSDGNNVYVIRKDI